MLSFNVNDSPGFYLYHGHHHAQRGDGLSGPFIIEDPAESLRTASWDAEYSLMIQDWYHERAGGSGGWGRMLTLLHSHATMCQRDPPAQQEL